MLPKASPVLRTITVSLHCNRSVSRRTKPRTASRNASQRSSRRPSQSSGNFFFCERCVRMDLFEADLLCTIGLCARFADMGKPRTACTPGWHCSTTPACSRWTISFSLAAWSAFRSPVDRGRAATRAQVCLLSTRRGGISCRCRRGFRKGARFRAAAGRCGGRHVGSAWTFTASIFPFTTIKTCPRFEVPHLRQRGRPRAAAARRGTRSSSCTRGR